MEDQLRMVRRNLEYLPDPQCSNGYHIRTYQKGDEIHWARIMDTAFIDQGRTAQDTYANVINQPDFDPNGFFFAIYEDLPIGTACAWKRCFRDEQVGYIDMLAVLPEHTGHKLGKWLTLFLLHYFKAQCLTCVVLDTDDFRLPAIKNYLNLGFMPIAAGEGHEERWRAIFEELNKHVNPR